MVQKLFRYLALMCSVLFLGLNSLFVPLKVWADSDDQMTQPLEELRIETQVVNTQDKVLGTLILTEASEEESPGVYVELSLTGIKKGMYRLGIHEIGLLTGIDFSDAGDLLEQVEVDQQPLDELALLKSLPSFEVAADGACRLKLKLDQLSLRPEAEYTLKTETGSSLIIYELLTDALGPIESDPGKRVAGAVIYEPLNPDKTKVKTDKDEASESDEVELADDKRLADEVETVASDEVKEPTTVKEYYQKEYGTSKAAESTDFTEFLEAEVGSSFDSFMDAGDDGQ